MPSAQLRPRTLLMLMAALVLAASLAMPASAFGMDVSKCTARSNAESGNDVLGATETRITLEMQSAADESVSALSFTMPEGTTFSTDDSRVTVLTGADLMTRSKVNATMNADGQTLNAQFSQPAVAGGFIRLEVYGVEFPTLGGDMQFSGTYTLSDGSVHDIQGIPSISVVGISPSQALSDSLSNQDWVKSWNSNKFLHLFLDPTVLVTSFPVVVNGFFMALAIVAVSFPLAIPFGLLLALMRMSRLKILRGLASLYVNIVRGTPLFLQIYIAFFGLPLAGVQIPAFPLGVIVLAMNSSAYQCEIMRAGIQSIPRGSSKHRARWA